MCLSDTNDSDSYTITCHEQFCIKRESNWERNKLLLYCVHFQKKKEKEECESFSSLSQLRNSRAGYELHLVFLLPKPCKVTNNEQLFLFLPLSLLRWKWLSTWPRTLSETSVVQKMITSQLLAFTKRKKTCCTGFSASERFLISWRALRYRSGQGRHDEPSLFREWKIKSKQPKHKLDPSYKSIILFIHEIPCERNALRSTWTIRLRLPFLRIEFSILLLLTICALDENIRASLS